MVRMLLLEILVLLIDELLPCVMILGEIVILTWRSKLMFLMLRLIVHIAGVTVLLIMYLRCLIAWWTSRRTHLLVLE